MKSGAALITLTVLVLLIAINSTLITRAVDEMYTVSVSGEDTTLEAIEAKYKKIDEIFSSRELFISLSVSHEDLSDIKMLLYEIKGALAAYDLDAAIIAKSRLDDALLHLGRLSSLNIESIF